MVKRGDVWLAALDPTVGSEIQKTRPCLVVSPDELNEHLRTVVVIPLTSKGQPAEFRVPVRFKGTDGLILLDQIRTLDKRRLVRVLGAIPGPVLDKTLNTLRDLFDPTSPPID